MAVREWKYSNGFDPALDFCEKVVMDDDYALTDGQKDLFLAFECSAESKSLTLGLDEGQFMIIANVGGENTVTVMNVSDDTGVDVSAGEICLVIGSKTADKTVINALYTPSL